MEFTKYDLYALQLLDYLVSKYDYRIVHGQQYRNDIWVINVRQAVYPLIRISSQVQDPFRMGGQDMFDMHRSIVHRLDREAILMVFHTNPQTEIVEQGAAKQVCVTPEEISDASILSIFHDIQGVIHDSDDIARDMVALSVSIEEAQQKQHKKVIWAQKRRDRPYCTIVCILIMTLLTLGATTFGYFDQNNDRIYVAMGAYYKMNVVAAYEYWRCITAAFLCSGPISLVLHVVAMYSIGRVCESAFKRREYIIIIFVSVLIGNVLLLVGEGNGIAMGFGAGMAGILGAYIVLLSEKRMLRHWQGIRDLITPCIVVALLTILPGLPIGAYIGGFVAGILLMILFSKAKRWHMLRVHTATSSIIIVSLIVYFSMHAQRVVPMNKALDQSIVNMYRHTPLQGYGTYLQACYQKEYRLE